MYEMSFDVRFVLKWLSLENEIAIILQIEFFQIEFKCIKLRGSFMINWCLTLDELKYILLLL